MDISQELKEIAFGFFASCRLINARADIQHPALTKMLMQSFIHVPDES
jgi:hypothetical protein